MPSVSLHAFRYLYHPFLFQNVYSKFDCLISAILVNTRIGFIKLTLKITFNSIRLIIMKVLCDKGLIGANTSNLKCFFISKLHFFTYHIFLTIYLLEK